MPLRIYLKLHIFASNLITNIRILSCEWMQLIILLWINEKYANAANREMENEVKERWPVKLRSCVIQYACATNEWMRVRGHYLLRILTDWLTDWQGIINEYWVIGIICILHVPCWWMVSCCGFLYLAPLHDEIQFELETELVINSKCGAS